MTYEIWFNSAESMHSKLVRSVLSLREEEWVVSDNLRTSGFWVLDGTVGQNLNALLSIYDSLRDKGIKVMFLSEDESIPDPDWYSIELPINASSLFNYFSEHFVHEESIEKENTGQKWKTQSFKLSSWPNIAKYGTDPSLSLVCSNLLRGYSSYETACSWGLQQSILDQILIDADINGSLMFDESGSQFIPQFEPEKMGLFQKFMKRFV